MKNPENGCEYLSIAVGYLKEKSPGEFISSEFDVFSDQTYVCNEEGIKMSRTDNF